MNTKPFRWTTWETWGGVAIVIVLGIIILANIGCASRSYCKQVDKEIKAAQFECLKESPAGWACNRVRGHDVYWAGSKAKEHHSHNLEGFCERWK